MFPLLAASSLFEVLLFLLVVVLHLYVVVWRPCGIVFHPFVVVFCLLTELCDFQTRQDSSPFQVPEPPTSLGLSPLGPFGIHPWLLLLM